MNGLAEEKPFFDVMGKIVKLQIRYAPHAVAWVRNQQQTTLKENKKKEKNVVKEAAKVAHQNNKKWMKMS